ncbi:Ferredoxin, leaf L-A [Porphyridium purpureum]|uniref:Ferredoxin, leaf L-A n=1 Tax=Porphyridium purpureum TaxID=35688 RepID=A0A5J4Z2S0_PORPP|nr:Ferredoxin, leaf L-A [Porphyridium purpureum]|eukprot:POR8201..scf295_1
MEGSSAFVSAGAGVGGKLALRHSGGLAASRQSGALRTAPVSRRVAAPLCMKVYTIAIKVDGKKDYKVQCDDETTLLEAMEEADIPGIDSSCRAGVCMTCSAKVLSGKYELGAAALAEEAESEGFVLTCSATPLSDMVIEVNQFNNDAYEMQYGQYEDVSKKEDTSVFGRFFK